MEIQNRIIKLREFFKKKHCKEHCVEGQCKNSFCLSSQLAETRAYYEKSIPQEFIQLTFDDFSGKVNNKIVLDPKDVLSVKDQIAQYCWNNDVKDADGDFLPYNPKIFNAKQILDKRREYGTNLVIHGDLWQKDSNLKHQRIPIGKSMLAAIVLKEVINLRMFNVKNKTDTYEWAEYVTLANRLMERAKKDYSEYSQYQNADWLVVNDIEQSSDSSTSFKASVLDQLFGERLDARLPSVLVFRDNLDKITDLRSQFGVHISSIILNAKTIKIKVNKNK